MPRLTWLSRALRLLSWLGVALLMAAPTLTWFGRLESLPMGQVLSCWALSLLPNTAVALGFVELGRFYRVLGARGAFSGAAARALRRFGHALIAGSVLVPVSRLAILAVLGADGPQPQGLAGLPGTTAVLAMALGVTLGLTLVVFSAILAEATRLARENAEFV